MPSWKLTEHTKNRRRGGAGTREHLPLPRRQTFEILYFSTHFKLKRTIKIPCLVPPCPWAAVVPGPAAILPPCRPVWFPSYHHLGLSNGGLPHPSYRLGPSISPTISVANFLKSFRANLRIFKSQFDAFLKFSEPIFFSHRAQNC